MRRLPRIIRLPGGFIIEVKLCRLSGEWGSWDYSIEAALGLIKINKRADRARQWRTLGHELHHAMTDYNHWLDYKVRELETAMGQTAAELREDD
jgi:hypothetical protein